MYWGVFTRIIIPWCIPKVLTKLTNNSNFFCVICTNIVLELIFPRNLLEQRISHARFSACGGSPLRHFSTPPQCNPAERFLWYRKFKELSYYRTKRTSPHHLPKSLCLEGLAPLCEPSTVSVSWHILLVRVLILAERFLWYRKFKELSYIIKKRTPLMRCSYRGDNQIRTGDDGVADRSLTAWLCRRI